MADPITKVGCGVLVFKDGKILLAKRGSSHGAGLWEGLGGHFEYMESFEACVRREVREECGIEIKNLTFLCVTNFKAYAPKHYVDIGFTAEWASGEPQTLEPDKFSTPWEWYDPEALPGELFDMTRNYLEAYRTGRNFFDA